MIKFKEYFEAYIVEDSSYSDGAMGNSAFGPNNLENSDWYAPGDFRIPTGGGVYTRRGKIKYKKKHRKSRKKKK